MADPCPVPEMSAKADIYLKENFGFRPKSRPVVAFGVKFKIFNLFGGLGGRVLRGGGFCLRGYAAQRRAAPCKNNRAAIVPKLVARVPRAFIGGTDLILPPRLFWNLFWSQKSNATPQMPFSRRRPPAANAVFPLISSIIRTTRELFNRLLRKFGGFQGKILVL